MVPFPDTSRLSAIAAELERRYPTASLGEIYAMAKPTVDNAVATAASQSHGEGILCGKPKLNTAPSGLFANSILGDTATSIHSQQTSARHTPVSVQQDVNFGTTSVSPLGQPSQTQPEAQHSHHLPHQPAETTPYDIESWFSSISTFPPRNGSTLGSSDFSLFHVIAFVSHYLTLERASESSTIGLFWWYCAMCKTSKLFS